ncbi:hypothetical protein CSKR_102599 [Clonorchis sinensis]|uniref:Uncharacterized protein n=1 Tax=Clonorchis sinensis TaxID=79923 RepID=A0A419PJP5_CLOSI|nr:hypothetical protein CSKR_102599 [Clonorchis sinensis]
MERSEPRRAISSAYSVSTRECPESISTSEVSEAGREISSSISITKAKFAVFQNRNTGKCIIIIIDSMTSVFNTDASLPYNHDLFESLIVKKIIKVKGWPPLCFRHSELGTENSTLFGKRWLGMRNTCPDQRSFWCYD